MRSARSTARKSLPLSRVYRARYNFFVLEVVKAWIEPKVSAPRTLHHRGRGEFVVAGRTLRLRSRAK